MYVHTHLGECVYILKSHMVRAVLVELIVSGYIWTLL